MVIFITVAYNAESTIERAIESVLSQTISEFQYYLIDNGSTDKTGEIIQAYANEDSRILTLRNEVNMVGNSSITTIFDSFFCQTKNNLDELFFANLDADDEYAPDFLEKMLAFLEKNDLDIAACGSDFIDAETNQLISVRDLNQNLILEGKAFEQFFPNYHKFMRTIWGKIYRFSLLKKCSFDKHNVGRYGADTLFAMETFRHAERVGILAGTLHKYYISKKSVSYKFDSKRIVSDCLLHETTIEFLLDYGPISQVNRDSLYCIYLSAIYDSIKVLLCARINPYEKLSSVIEIFTSQHTRDVAAFTDLGSYVGWAVAITKRESLFEHTLSWLLSLQEVPDELVLKYCEVGEFVSAAIENAGAWVFFNKLRINFLLDLGERETAVKKLSELEKLLPGDVELAELRMRLSG